MRWYLPPALETHDVSMRAIISWACLVWFVIVWIVSAIGFTQLYVIIMDGAWTPTSAEGSNNKHTDSATFGENHDQQYA
jgi:hypothetical protein